MCMRGCIPSLAESKALIFQYPMGGGGGRGFAVADQDLKEKKGQNIG